MASDQKDRVPRKILMTLNQKDSVPRKILMTSNQKDRVPRKILMTLNQKDHVPRKIFMTLDLKVHVATEHFLTTTDQRGFNEKLVVTARKKDRVIVEDFICSLWFLDSFRTDAVVHLRDPICLFSDAILHFCFQVPRTLMTQAA
jgi:hypothetical protein